MELIKSSTKLFVARFSNAVLTFVGLAYFAQRIPQSALGTFFLYQSILQLLSIPASFGQGGALVKRLSEDINREQFFGTSIALMIIATTLTGILVFIASPVVNWYFKTDLVLWLILGIVVVRLNRLGIGVLKGELRVGSTADILFFQKLVWVVGGALLIYRGFAVRALVISFILGNLVAAGLAFYRMSTRIGRPTLYHARSLIQYWKWSSVSFVDGYLYNWADITILGYFVGPAVVAAYEIAWRIGSLAMIFTESIETALLPEISNLNMQKETDKIRGHISDGIFLSFFLVFPITAGAFSVGEDILTIIFGQEYVIAAIPLLILLLGKQIEVIDRIYKNVLSGIDKPRYRAIAALTSGVGNVVLNIALIPLYGAVGAAVATSVAFTISTIIIVYYLNVEMELVFPSAQVLTIGVSATVMGVAVFALSSVIGINSVYDLAFIIVSGAVVYGVQCALFQTSRKPLIRFARTVLPVTRSRA
ncbi:flippase [Halapricum salinum]|uniref:Flippase n=1 Tax=Halapricum salinum TaxID=1457250 RepID=A0A4D6HFA3_9EURY|nr:flippase [Halapricum salinum]QCC51732.1 flippase [Halapricum salinum]